MLLAYIRCSSVDQNEARQVKAMLDYGVAQENLFIDKLSGKNTDRPQLKALLQFCRRGDCIVVESLSRLARNTKDLLNVVDELSNKGVDFISLKESIDTTTPQGRFMLTVFAAMATLERECILERQAEGIAIAKQNGVYKGGHRKEVNRELFTSITKRWRTGSITATEAMKLLNLKPNTFYRRVKEWGL